MEDIDDWLRNPGKYVVVSNSADRILRIAPDDKIAIQAKLFAFNSKGQPQEAVKFIREICARNPQDSRLCMMHSRDNRSEILR